MAYDRTSEEDMLARAGDLPREVLDVVNNKVLRTLAVGLVVTFPFLKILYATQSSAITGEVIRLHGPTGWFSVVVDNVLRYPLLFLVIFVILSASLSLVSFVGDVSRRITGVEEQAGDSSRVVTALLALTTPLIGLFWALALFGWRWAIATFVVALLYRLPADLYELRQVKRSREGLPPEQPSARLVKAAVVDLYVMVLLLLPAAAAHTVLDGEAWESIRECTVASATEGDHTARVVEIDRGGAGITTGWEIGTTNIVAGSGCVDSGYRVRDAFWD